MSFMPICKQGKFTLLIVFYLLLSGATYGQSSEQLMIDSLRVLIDKSKEDTNKVALLCQMMSYHVYYKQSQGLKYEQPALDLAKQLNWKEGVYRVKQTAGKIYWRMSKFDSALDRHFSALAIAKEMGNKRLIAATLSAIGQDYADNANYLEALKYLRQALATALEARDMNRAGSVYNLISWVHEQQGSYADAIENNIASLKMAQEIGNEDLQATSLSNIGENYLRLGNDSLALIHIQRSIDIRTKIPEPSIVDEINVSDSYLAVGFIYQKAGDFDKALRYYERALEKGKHVRDLQTTTNAYHYIAQLYVSRGDDEKALSYLRLAVESSWSLQDARQTAELFFGMAGCYARLKKYKDARAYYEEARVLSEKTQSESLNYQYYEGVEVLDSIDGNWKNAYLNYKSAIRLKGKLFSDESTKKMLQTTMQYEFEKREAVRQAEQEKKDEIQRTVRNAIAIALGGSLLFLLVVMNQRNKLAKARKRSDELLLNILPTDVADELKRKGSADARYFEEVTVMFTDFREFTKVSELLSPAELVQEINTCFVAFDRIVTKYNVEKIKTIGDAYMAAGGLPTPNTTNAEDVVNAALEIRQFMKAYAEERARLNKPVFEIRIGVHTGPVVAGIVGIKKFAYDIWGDTVNIASRMESSGEAGRVNVSSRVYELVNDKFVCVHRGKVQAKGKGEIDMYFVEERK